MTSKFFIKKVLICKWQEEEDYKILYEKYNGLDNRVRDNLKFKILEEKYKKKDEIELINKMINDEKYQNRIIEMKEKLFNSNVPISDPIKILRELYEKY